MLRTKGKNIQTTDQNTTTADNIRTHIEHISNLLEQHWDLADTSRRATSVNNRNKTSKQVIPELDIGDHVLYAVHKPDTKLDYKWRGPGTITKILSPLVYKVEPDTMHEVPPLQVHVTRDSDDSHHPDYTSPNV